MYALVYRSLGLAMAPKVRFLKKDQQKKEEMNSKKDKQTLNLSKLKKMESSTDESDSDESDSDESDIDSDEKGSDNQTGYKSDDELSSNTENEKLSSDLERTSELVKSEKVKSDLTKERTNTSTIEISSKGAGKKVTLTQNEGKSFTSKGDKVVGESSEDSGEESDDENESETMSDKEKTPKKDGGGESSFQFDMEEEDDDGELFKVKRNVDIDEILTDKVCVCPVFSEAVEDKRG